jgi:hypothetical protein
MKKRRRGGSIPDMYIPGCKTQGNKLVERKKLGHWLLSIIT